MFENIENVRALLNEDYRNTITGIWNKLDAVGCSHASVGQIVRDMLGNRKVSSR